MDQKSGIILLQSCHESHVSEVTTFNSVEHLIVFTIEI